MLSHSVLEEQKIIDTLRIGSQHSTCIERTQEIEHSELRLLKVLQIDWVLDDAQCACLGVTNKQSSSKI
jgi:hypothetical protein